MILQFDPRIERAVNLKLRQLSLAADYGQVPMELYFKTVSDIDQTMERRTRKVEKVDLDAWVRQQNAEMTKVMLIGALVLSLAFALVAYYSADIAHLMVVGVL